MEESKFDLVKYKNSYNSEKYDRITIMPPKGSREVYQRAAAKAGESVTKYIINAIKTAAAEAGQSVNAYINQAIAERMERDKASKDETKE